MPLEAAPTGRQFPSAAGLAWLLLEYAWPEHPLLSLHLPQHLFSTFQAVMGLLLMRPGLCFWFVATGPKVFSLKASVKSKDLKIASCTLKGGFECVGSGEVACAGPGEDAHLYDTWKAMKPMEWQPRPGDGIHSSEEKLSESESDMERKELHGQG